MNSAPAAEPVRTGVLFRIAASRGERGPVLMLPFVDLRLGDGHIERWLGPAMVSAEVPSDFCRQATTVFDEIGTDLWSEIADDLVLDADGRPDLGVPEAVVEWNAPLPDELPPPPWR